MIKTMKYKLQILDMKQQVSIWWGKTSVNDTLPNFARTTDNSVCLPMHIQGLCQRQRSWKNQDNQTNRQTDRLTNILKTISACQDFCK